MKNYITKLSGSSTRNCEKLLNLIGGGMNNISHSELARRMELSEAVTKRCVWYAKQMGVLTFERQKGIYDFVIHVEKVGEFRDSLRKRRFDIYINGLSKLPELKYENFKDVFDSEDEFKQCWENF